MIAKRGPLLNSLKGARALKGTFKTLFFYRSESENRFNFELIPLKVFMGLLASFKSIYIIETLLHEKKDERSVGAFPPPPPLTNA